jgi:hypothetical protein
MDEDTLHESDEQHIRRMYRTMRAGQNAEILNDMLRDLKFLDPCKSEGDMALNNYAKQLVVKVFCEDDGQVKSSRLWRLLKKLTGK